MWRSWGWLPGVIVVSAALTGCGSSGSAAGKAEDGPVSIAVGKVQAREVRRTIDRRVSQFAQRLQHDPTLLAKGEELKRELLEHPEVRAWLESLWLSLKEGMVAAASDPRSELRVRLLTGLQHIGERLASEPELQHKLDSWVERAVGYFVEHYRSEVSDLIATTVERWDTETTSRKVELPDTGHATIGRGDTCEVRLKDGTASRTHARLEADANGVRLLDLGSANGTLVNGEKVTGATPLQTGDVISVAGANLVLRAPPRRFPNDPMHDAPSFRRRLDEELERALRYAVKKR